MVEKNKKRCIYAVTAAIFFIAAAVNAWMVLDEGITVFRMIALIAFALGAILLLSVFKRASSSRN